MVAVHDISIRCCLTSIREIVVAATNVALLPTAGFGVRHVGSALSRWAVTPHFMTPPQQNASVIPLT